MKYHVIPHHHWDREWFFTQQKATLYLLHDLDEIIAYLEEHPEYPYFLCDAQTSLIDDYLSFRPENKERLTKLITEGRILTGPWYTQTDLMIVHGEVIARNLYYGTEEAEKYGHCFKVGYVPDAFGQNAQMPQLYQGFGIDKVLFVRGVDTRKIPKDHFIWRCEDGTEVYAVHSFGYMTFRNPSKDTEVNEKVLKADFTTHPDRNDSGHVLLFNGFDQFPIRKDIVSIVNALKGKGMEIDFESLEEVLQEISKQAELPVYEGEMICGETTRAHRSIYSSRADIKILNSQVENLMVRQAEPLQAISYDLLKHEEKEYLKHLYKLIMENDAHDSSGCCNTDAVNAQIKAKYLYVKNGVEEYKKLTKRLIAQHIAQDAFSLQVYNYLPYEREEEVEFTIMSPYKRIALKDREGNLYPVRVIESKELVHQNSGPFSNLGLNGVYEDPYPEGVIYQIHGCATLKAVPMGYATYSVCEAEKMDQGCRTENEYIAVSVNTNGSLEISNRKTGKVYHQALLFEDSADAGDSYNYSPAWKDRYYTSEECVAENVQATEAGISYELKMKVPANLEERAENICSKELSIQVRISVDAKYPMVLFHVSVDNTAMEHRVRVLLNTEEAHDNSYADNLFGELERSVYPEEADWRAEKWSEAPCTISPMQSYVYLKGSELAGVVTDSVKEYEIVGENYSTLAYTLFRSFPYMGRSDLPSRPGRASGREDATPDARLLGRMDFSFAYIFASDNTEFCDAASNYTTPLEICQRASYDLDWDFTINETFEKDCPDTYSAFKVDGKNTRLSIFKVAEEEGLIARFYQLKDGQIKIDRKVKECSLNEKDEREFSEEKEYRKNAIVTLKLEEKVNE